MTSRATKKQITQAQISRRAAREALGRSGLTGRAAELGRGYPPAKPTRAAQHPTS